MPGDQPDDGIRQCGGLNCKRDPGAWLHHVWPNGSGSNWDLCEHLQRGNKVQGRDPQNAALFPEQRGRIAS